MSAPLLIRWNGQPVDRVPAEARALHYGDGVFRTVLLHAGTIVDRSRQLARLGDDAVALGLEPPSPQRLDAELAVAATLGEATVKLLLSRVAGARGYRPASAAADLLLLAYPPPAPAPAESRDGIAAIRSPVTLAAQPLLAGIKHLNRLEQVLASRDWPDGVAEAILGDDRGAPVCATRANLFWLRQGVLHTPALDRCGVAGVTRDRVLETAAELGLECRIGSAPWAALLAADEAFLSSSLIGIRPLARLDGHRWPSSRPLTRRLQQRLGHPANPRLETLR